MRTSSLEDLNYRQGGGMQVRNSQQLNLSNQKQYSVQKKHIVYRPSTGSKVKNMAETYQPHSNQKGSGVGSGSQQRPHASRPASSKL